MGKRNKAPNDAAYEPLVFDETSEEHIVEEKIMSFVPSIYRYNKLTALAEDVQGEDESELGSVHPAGVKRLYSDYTYAEDTTPRYFLKNALKKTDPAKLLSFLCDEDLFNLARTSRGSLAAVECFVAIRRVKLRMNPSMPLKDYWKNSAASKGGGIEWSRLKRRLNRNVLRHAVKYEDGSTLSRNTFLHEYEEKSIPVVLSRLTVNWKANEYNWTLEVFHKRYGKIKWRFSDLHPLEIKLNDFVTYAKTTEDDSPLGLYDSQIGMEPDADDPRVICLSEFLVPPLFCEDLYNVLPNEVRPPFRWILIGLPRGGTSMHVDPLHTSAWVTLVSGTKRWCLFPPSFDSALLGGCSSDEPAEEDAGQTIPTAYEFFKFVYPKLSLMEDVEMYEILQKPGDTVFVPAGWKHVVMNLEFSVAVTQNYLASHNLEHSLKCLQGKEPEMYLQYLKSREVKEQQ